jgi:two-component system NtrC family sensor kinase
LVLKGATLIVPQESAPQARADGAGASQSGSLRAKGLLVLSVLLAYMLTVLLVIGLQWRKSLDMNEHSEALHRLETKVEMVQSSLSHAIINLQEAMESGNPKDLDTDLALLLSDMRALEDAYPSLSRHRQALAGDLARLGRDMASDTPRMLRINLEATALAVGRISDDMHESKRLLLSAHFKQQGLIAIVGIALSLTAFTLFVAMTTVFLKELTRDLKKLEVRAMDIVMGYDGPPLDVKRQDEVGGLMNAINHTQSELRAREKQLELSRQQRFYQDKMATIGSLAAGVAHEINNPIAAISGIAQYISDKKASHRCSGNYCQPELILEHTRRIALISRQLAELASTHSERPDLLDLNGLVERVGNFLGYDARFAGVDVVLELDRTLPAVHSVADHVTQVLMNLMINAADALEGASGRPRTIRVSTGMTASGVLLSVTDNGDGMDKALLSRVFDESFTTKPLEKGSGLGLFLCRNLLEQNGGRIELESVPKVGTTARVVLPMGQQTLAA